MTQASQQVVQLAPHQVYIKRPRCSVPVQSLVTGYADWSYHEWPHHRGITLYYKGRYVMTLFPLEAGGLTDERPDSSGTICPNSSSADYTSLADAIQTYECQMERLRWIDQQNKEEGLEEWCIRQNFAVATLHLDIQLPQQERERIERLAAFDGVGSDTASIERLALKALYAYLPEIEGRYNRYYERYPEERENAGEEERR